MSKRKPPVKKPCPECNEGLAAFFAVILTLVGCFVLYMIGHVNYDNGYDTGFFDGVRIQKQADRVQQ